MKKSLSRLLCLLLCAALLLPLIPTATAITADAKGMRKDPLAAQIKEGPAIKKPKAVFTPNAAMIRAKAPSVRAIGGGENNGYYTEYTFETFKDLKELASKTYDSRTVFRYQGSSSVFTISENLVLPANTQFHVYTKIVIPAGVTFTTTQFDYGSSCHGLEVNGVYNSNTSLEVYDELTVNGKLNLNANLWLYPDTVLTGLKNITYSESAYKPAYWHYIDTAAEVYEAIDQTNADPNKLEHHLFLQPESGSKITFSKSLTIPANCRLSLQGNATYVIPSGVTMTLNGTLDMQSWSEANPVLKINGSLINNGGISIICAASGSPMMVFGSTGKYSGAATLQLDGFGRTYDWTEIITGLNADNLEITGGTGWYTIRDLSSLTKLSAPTNLTWHKAMKVVDGENKKVTLKGAVSWTSSKIQDDSDDYQYYIVTVYRDGESVYQNTWGYGDKFDQDGWCCYVDTSTYVNWESGTYYFTVQAVPNPWTNNSKYRASDVVKSSSWTYTKPASLSKPTKLTWNWPTMKWSGPSGHKYFDVYIEYAPTEQGEFEYVYGACYEMGNSYMLDIYDLEYFVEYYGAGYYRFKVRTMSTDITSKYHSAWSAYSDTYYFDGKLELTAPTLTASNVASTGKIKLTWNVVPGAAKYQIVRSLDNKNWEHLAYSTGTSATNTKTDAGTTYYYKIRAIDANGNKSKYSNVVSRMCDLPQPKVTASNVASTGKIKLSWNAVEGAAKYQIVRSLDNVNWEHLTYTTNTSATNTKTDAGKTYYYKVRAVHSDSAATSAYSAVVSRTCDLPQVTGLKATNVTSTGKIKLSWNAVEGAAKYQIVRSLDKTNWEHLSYTTGTSATNTKTDAGKTYYYKVRAVHTNSDATSAYSAVVSRTCDLAQPTLTVKLNSNGKPTLSWNAITGAVKYQIVRSTDNKNWEHLAYSTGTSATNTKAEAGIKYYYKIRAIHSNTDANSAYSAVKYITAK